MKRLSLIILIVLCSCSTYQPTLQTPPVDQSKYSEDLQKCRDEARPSPGAETSIVMGGLIGLAIHDATNPGSNDFESASTTIRKCLIAKGYDVQDK